MDSSSTAGRAPAAMALVSESAVNASTQASPHTTKTHKKNSWRFLKSRPRNNPSGERGPGFFSPIRQVLRRICSLFWKSNKEVSDNTVGVNVVASINAPPPEVDFVRDPSPTAPSPQQEGEAQFADKTKVPLSNPPISEASSDVSETHPDDASVGIDTLCDQGYDSGELYHTTGDLTHLDDAITSYRKARDLTTAEYAHRDEILNNLATKLRDRFNQTGDTEDLDEAIHLLQECLVLCPPGNPSRASVVNNLATCYSTRHDEVGDPADLDAAIRMHWENLTLRPPGHPNRDTTLNNLATCLTTRFEHLRDVADLEEALHLHQENLEVRYLGHPKRHTTLNNLASCMSLHYDRTGDVGDLQEAIRLHQENLELRQPGHPSRDSTLYNLATCLSTRYDRLGDIGDLQEAIRIHQENLAICQPSNPWIDSIMGNLAACLSTRYNALGYFDDLQEAIHIEQECMELRPPGDPSRHTTLNNLGSYISKRYEAKGDIRDLEDAIRLHQENMELRKSGHPKRHATLDNLALCIASRYDRSGNMADLDQAISLHQESIALLSQQHLERDKSLNNLASCYTTRYDRSGDVADLEDAIRIHRECLNRRPPGNPSRDFTLNNLAICLAARYYRLDDPSDLDEAIRLHEETLRIRQHPHPLRDSTLNNLALCMSMSYDRMGDIDDLEMAIRLHQECLGLRGQGHPLRDWTLYNLALCLSDRYDRTGETEDLEAAIRTHRETLALRPSGHPGRSLSLSDLANCLSFLLDSQDSIDEIVEMLREATLPSLSPVSHRLQAANTWRRVARKNAHPSELDATKETLHLLDLAVAESTSVEGVSDLLSEDASFRSARGAASDAAALAIAAGDVRLAVSLLEQGRSNIFTHLGRYRWALDDVLEASPTLAKRFIELSAELNTLVLRTRGVRSGNSGPVNPLEDIASRHYRTHTAWSNTIDEIRLLPGFEAFLLPPTFEQLQKAATEGPIVVVNVNAKRSDAIIVLANDAPILVPLPDVTPEQVRTLADRLGERPAECDIRIAKPMLRQMWKMIVEPIASQLREAPIGIPPKSRIWWCPTGPASRLPLHAAGPYARGEQNLPQIVVSSYTPTLGALIRARQSKIPGPATESLHKTILVVGQANTPGEKPLPKVNDEVQAICTCAPHASMLQSSAGTREAVLDEIPKHEWLHLACHGHHHAKQPFHSYFSMHNGPITLLDLIGKNLPHGELAVLSACHSARVSESLPDEALHPAAGMLFAGYKSVIGTMWAFDDGFGSALAGRFYELMLEGGRDHSDAAAVLADAVQELTKKDKDSIPFMQRINVVHYGV